MRQAGTAGFADRTLYESLEQALAALTAAQYGRNGTLTTARSTRRSTTGSQVLQTRAARSDLGDEAARGAPAQRQGDTRAWSR